MKLPWKKGKKERIEELEEKVEELEEERDSLEKRFEAEKNRRSELARKKQEAEEELNRLKDRVESLEDSNGKQDQEKEEKEVESLSFGETRRLLEKLGSIESPEEDLVTVYSSGKLEEVEDLKGLKNTLNLEQVRRLREEESFTAFMDPDIPDLVLKVRPFFRSGWMLSDSFDVQKLLDFMDSGKTWVLVSAGETTVYEEESGDCEQVERVASRVDRQHGKGGYSQDRFEKKREEQIDQHLEEVEEAIGERENVYLLGSRDLCKELSGERLGGFDPNASPPEVFYSFQLVR